MEDTEMKDTENMAGNNDQDNGIEAQHLDAGEGAARPPPKKSPIFSAEFGWVKPNGIAPEMHENDTEEEEELESDEEAEDEQEDNEAAQLRPDTGEMTPPPENNNTPNVVSVDQDREDLPYLTDAEAEDLLEWVNGPPLHVPAEGYTPSLEQAIEAFEEHRLNDCAKICLQIARKGHFGVTDVEVMAAMRLMKKTGLLYKAKHYCNKCIEIVLQEWKFIGTGEKKPTSDPTYEKRKYELWRAPNGQLSLLVMFARFRTKLEEIVDEDDDERGIPVAGADTEVWRAWFQSMIEEQREDAEDDPTFHKARTERWWKDAI
ncbi:hypothetical protein NA57DRAFT_71753 [Rhizodiscina lignyota]|uniref:Uncharacterized protein n=1 Tax=Rhizodiscina lignyota TaxID=1504668 RepID=A0A9P4INJ1_9PEZI|nr:hypothetical protein NA57DRAFT_71753 [Rhizodiscina lignyota]